jgi:hypothetical protein
VKREVINIFLIEIRRWVISLMQGSWWLADDELLVAYISVAKFA